MTIYAKLAADREVIGFFGAEDPPDMVGPIEPHEDDDGEYRLVSGPLALPPRPNAACLIYWPDDADAPGWVDPRPLADIQAEAIAAIDAFADACRIAVVGDAARIKEYERAQLGAEQYRAAGYTGTVPPPVASWAHAKRREGWTPKQAADDILAASARWYVALDGIRAMRLDAKETIRAAATSEEVATTVATFRATLTAAMQGVQ